MQWAPQARLAVAHTLKEKPVAIDEIERTALVNQLITTLGEEPAATLMKCVLPDGADHLATKDDLRACEERMHAYVDRAIARQTRTIMLSMSGIMAALMTAFMTPLYAGLLG